MQVGDPFEEKRLIEACLELLDAGLAVGVQDLGAAGLSCAASETAAKAGAGMDVDIARVRRREPGMNAGRGDDVREPGADARDRRARTTSTRCSSSCERWEIRATVVGRVTDTGRFRVFDGLLRRARRARREPAPPPGDARPTVSSDREPVADVPVGSLGDGPALPPAARARPRDQDARAGRRSRADARAPRSRPAPTSSGELLALLATPTIADKIVGVAPVRPPAVPQHRRRARRRRRGAPAQGHRRAGARARDRRQGAASAGSTRAPAAGSPCSRRRATSPCAGARAARARELPQLRQPRAPRGHVAVLRGRRRA